MREIEEVLLMTGDETCFEAYCCGDDLDVLEMELWISTGFGLVDCEVIILVRISSWDTNLPFLN